MLTCAAQNESPLDLGGSSAALEGWLFVGGFTLLLIILIILLAVALQFIKRKVRCFNLLMMDAGCSVGVNAFAVYGRQS